jgi:hypothetical protein
MPAETQSAGAMPVAGGATPPQTPDQPATVTPPQQPSQPATGTPDADGMTTDAGRRALREEREARATLQRELDELKGQNRTESEKALEAAKKAGASEADGRWSGLIRKAEVRTALMGAGIQPSVLDLAVGASEFAGLKVNDKGEVEGLEAAVDAFKKARTDLFTPKSQARPDAGLGPRGTPAAGTETDMNSLIRRKTGRL